MLSRTHVEHVVNWYTLTDIRAELCGKCFKCHKVLLFYSIENSSDTRIVNEDEPHEARLGLLVDNFNLLTRINARNLRELELDIVKSLQLACQWFNFII